MPDALLKFIRFLLILTCYRIVLILVAKKYHILGIEEQAKIITKLPWQVTLLTPWEDAVFGMPLVILDKLYSNTKLFRLWFYPLVAMSMISFGSGHAYQGFLSAALLALYIPYSIKYSKKFGVGTVMLCHIMFDLATILTFKFMLG
jgi:hypothetical protein